MRPKNWLLPLSLGLPDGVLNALALALSTIVRGGAALRVGLAIRVGLVGLVTGVFTVFVAQYTSFRSRLARSERQLNFTRSGRLLRSELGPAVAYEAARPPRMPQWPGCRVSRAPSGPCCSGLRSPLTTGWLL